MAQIKVYMNGDSKNCRTDDNLVVHPALNFTVDGKMVKVLTDCADGQLVKRIATLMKVFGTDMSKDDVKSFIRVLTADGDITVTRDMCPVVKFTINGGGPDTAYTHLSWGVVEVNGDDISFTKKISEELGVLLSSVSSNTRVPSVEKIKIAAEAIKQIHGYSVESIEFESARKYRDDLTEEF